MLKLSKQRYGLRMLAILLGGLLLLTGCNMADPQGNGTPTEELFTGSQGAQLQEDPTEQPTERPTEQPTEQLIEDPTQPQTSVKGVDNNAFPSAPTPIAPPATVTQRNVGVENDPKAGGTLYNGDSFFFATVLKTYDDAVLVQPYAGTQERQMGEQILISTVGTNSLKYNTSVFSEGDLLRVTYQGEITPANGDNPATLSNPVRFQVMVHGFGSDFTPYFCTGVVKAHYVIENNPYDSPMNLGGEGASPVFHITSVEELEACLDLFVYLTFDGMGNTYYNRPEGDFLLATYGEAYFAQNDLILTSITEGSGSYDFLFWDVTIANGVAEMTVAKLIPGMGTCDMARWLAFAEVSKEALRDVESYRINHIELSVSHTQSLPAPGAFYLLQDRATEFFGKEVKINEVGSNTVYCGTYGNCNVITFATRDREQVTSLTVNGKKFAYYGTFEIWVERDGEFLTLSDAWEAGWLTTVHLLYLNYSWGGYLSYAAVMDIIPTENTVN